MKNSRKIFTSAFLASVIAFSLTMGAVADETDAPEALAEIESEVTVSVTEPDEPPVIEDQTEAAEPRYVDSFEYIGELKTARIKGGTVGYVTVKYGIYKRYRDGGGGHKQFVCYGASIQLDYDSDKNNLNADLSIIPTYRTPSEEYTFDEITDYTDRLFFDYPTGIDYLNFTVTFSVESKAFGGYDNTIHRNAE